MYKSQNKIVSNFLKKLLNYRIVFKDILTFLGLGYRNASLITFYTFLVLGIGISKILVIEKLRFKIRVNFA